MTRIKEKLQKVIYFIFDPFVSLIRKIGITPNIITTIGFFVILGAFFFISFPLFSEGKIGFGRLIGFGLIIIFSGLFDVLDGRMARSFKLQSTYGAFYDSVIDRYSEIVMFLGLILFSMAISDYILFLLCFVALGGSLMVSYTRARAEGLNVDCKVGLLQRPERILMLTLTCIVAGLVDKPLAHMVLYFGIGTLAILANYTAIQRIWHVWNRTEKHLTT